MPPTDPIDALAVGVAADHTEKKRTRAKKGAAEQPAGDETPIADATDTTAAAAIEAAGAARDAGGDADQVVAAVVGGAAAGEAEAQAQAEQPAADEPAPDVPASPGDDADSVFDRRLARLTTLVDEAEFEGGTAFGDLRDCILDLFKHRPKLWSAMPPSEQQDVIRHVEALAKQVLEKVVLVIAQEDDVSIQATLLPAFNIKGESIEAKIKIDHVGDDEVLDVYRLAGHKVVVIDAASKRFMSARRTQDPGKDQLDMQFAGDARPAAPPPPPAHPADDSDLAGEDDETAEEEAEAPTGDDWGVFDTERGEWLIDKDGGDDGWTSNSGDAGRWPHDEAKALATDFGDGGDAVVARQLGDDPAPPAEEAQAES